MFMTIIIVVLVLTTLVAIFAKEYVVGTVIALVGLIACGFSMTATIDDGNVGVMQTFGKYSDRTLEPGFQLKWPWQSVEEVNTRERAYYYGAAEAEINNGVQAGGPITAQAEGEGQITYDATIQAAPAKNKVVPLLRSVGPDWWDTIGQSAVRSCLRDAASTVTVSEALTTGRDDMAEATKTCLVGEDGDGGKIGDNGIVVYGIDIRGVNTTPEILDAINRAEAADRNIEIAKDELAKAEIDGRTQAVQAFATSQAEQIVACGGIPQFDEETGEAFNVVAKADEECDEPFSDAYLTWELIQKLDDIQGAVYLPAGLDPANLVVAPGIGQPALPVE